MIDHILQIIAPHHCCNCQKLGHLLCDNCKYDIITEPYVGCISCGRPTMSGACASCKLPYTAAWCAGERQGSLEALINRYKFERAKAGAHTCAAIFNEIIPVLPARTVVVPIPTIAKHVRQRGYDHTLLIAKKLAQQRHLRCDTSLLQRQHNQVQRGASKKERIAQAATAFRATKPLQEQPVLLIDDVVTTGATIQYAAQALKEAGAGPIMVGVLARQPLDKLT